jgi:hypothetical protein
MAKKLKNNNLAGGNKTVLEFEMNKCQHLPVAKPTRKSGHDFLWAISGSAVIGEEVPWVSVLHHRLRSVGFLFDLRRRLGRGPLHEENF